MMRGLVIDHAVKSKVVSQAIWANQPENWYHPDTDKEPPGDNPAYTLMLEVGFRTVYSQTVMKGERFRHLSISVAGTKYPNEIAAWTIATLYGFTGAEMVDDAAVKPGKDWMMDINREQRCVVLAQRIAT